MLGKWSRCFRGGIQPSTARITASTLLSTDDEEAWMRALQFVFKALVSMRQRMRFDERLGSLSGSVTHSWGCRRSSWQHVGGILLREWQSCLSLTIYAQEYTLHTHQISIMSRTDCLDVELDKGFSNDKPNHISLSC